MESDNSTVSPVAVSFQKEFTQQAIDYLSQNPDATIKGFAVLINVTEDTLWQWANKKKKDEQGNLTEQLARPNFHAALQNIVNAVPVIPVVPEPVVSVPEPVKEDKLNARQELFCQLYATDREFFGNGVQTYIQVYEPDQHKPNWYKSACSSASEMLSNPKLYNRINELLSDEGLNDAFVDKQLLFVIAQHDDKSSKVAAIREYNKLKKRVTEKIEATIIKPKPIYGGKSTKQV